MCTLTSPRGCPQIIGSHAQSRQGILKNNSKHVWLPVFIAWQLVATGAPPSVNCPQNVTVDHFAHDLTVQIEYICFSIWRWIFDILYYFSTTSTGNKPGFRQADMASKLPRQSTAQFKLWCRWGLSSFAMYHHCKLLGLPMVGCGFAGELWSRQDYFRWYWGYL